MRRRLLLIGLVVATALAIAAAAWPRHSGAVAAPRPFTGKLTYDETSPGKDGAGGAVKGVVGQGAFSGKLTGKALLAATLAELVKGVPAAALAKGGTWVARYDIDAKGDYTGILVATFTSPGLGSLCLSGKTVHGKYVSGFIPASGSLTAIGGTGTAAKLRLVATFKQTAITGSDVEQFTGTGAFKTLSMGAAKPLTARCKAVAKLRH